MTGHGPPSRDRCHGRIARPRSRGLLVLALLVAGLTTVAPCARADTFAGAYYDPASDSLVVTLVYGGTNSHHKFTLQWGSCSTPAGGGVSEIPAEVLDNQWQDAVLRNYTKTVHFGLGAIPCRPAEVTLRTAPRFRISVYVPWKAAKK